MVSSPFDAGTEQRSESSSSTVPWGAIIGGAFAASGLSIILLLVGSGFGLAVISPWPGASASTAALGVGAVIWLIVVQWLSSGLGGYLAGRLRPRSLGVHPDEAHFRDTASGLLVWAVATVLGAVIVASTVSMIAGHAARGATSIAAGVVQGVGQGAAHRMGAGGDPSAYFIDTLFRTDTPKADASTQDTRAEAGRILMTGFANGDVSGPDKAYLAKLVATQTDLSPADAQKRVDDVIIQAKAAAVKVQQAADAAKKAATTLTLFTAFAMLIGAFIAAAAGALGGHDRDRWSERLAR